MLFQRIKQLYHIRRPRVISDNDRSLVSYRKELKQAMKGVYLDAKQYQNKIEDQYLEDHMEEMRRRHFNNECNFRKSVMQQSFKLHEDMITWKKQDNAFEARLNKYLHDEDMKKINRKRIAKILEHESQNYWLNGENAEERLTESLIFPEYIAATEYYHKLHAEALAYENYDMNLLHKLSSNEETLKEKNKYLIPLFVEIRKSIVKFKKDSAQDIRKKTLIIIDKLEQSVHLTAEEKVKLIAEETQRQQSSIKEIEANRSTPEGKKAYYKAKIIELINLLKLWKDYTNILGLTSAQVLKKLGEKQSENIIIKEEKDMMKTFKIKSESSFIQSIEEDTEEIQISLEQYIKKIKDQQHEAMPTPEGGSVAEGDLEFLLSTITPEVNGSGSINLDKQQRAGQFIKGMDVENEVEGQIKISPEYLNFSETSTSVEVLKEMYKEDVEMIELLNYAGEISMDYPQLFQKIWELEE